MPAWCQCFLINLRFEHCFSGWSTCQHHTMYANMLWNYVNETTTIDSSVTNSILYFWNALKIQEDIWLKIHHLLVFICISNREKENNTKINNTDSNNWNDLRYELVDMWCEKYFAIDKICINSCNFETFQEDDIINITMKSIS